MRPRLSLSFVGGRRLPMLLQTEAAECGLACLAMVSSYWGRRIDLTTMRRRFSISLKGVKLKGLIAMAKAMGFQSRPVKVDSKSLSGLRLPCLLHWDMNHFVVLKLIKRNVLVIHDPAFGERRLSIEDASQHFTGVALELMPAADFVEADETQRFTWVSLLGRIVGLRRGLFQLLVLGVALQVCALLLPFYLQWIVDESLVAADRDLVAVLSLGCLLLVAVQTSIGAVRAWITTTFATDLRFQWLGNAFAHLLSLPISYFERRHLGDVVSRFGSIQSLQHAITTQFIESVIDGLLVVGTGMVMLLYSPMLTGVAGGAVLLYALLRWGIFRSLREASAQQIVHAAKQQTNLIESARGVQSIRLFGRVEERRIGWMNILADQFNAELRLARLSISYQTANTLLFGVERVVVTWLAALAVIEARFSVGMLIAFLSYKDQFSQRLAALIDRLYDLRMMKLHGERVADIVMTEAEAAGHGAEVDLTLVVPSIEVRNVSFRYGDAESYVLRGLDLSIPAGQCVAITGVSGCGKTTLVKLLLGLLQPTEGDILVGGIKLQLLGTANLRELMGTVMQDDQLFSGSIADNIGFFDSSPSQGRIERCAQLAAVHDEIIAMPMGYNTLVGDLGSGLSGGQRQRILLARALYKQPKILLLDEATSHLDICNEQLVNSAISQISMTRLLIAHRPETIEMAQRIIVLHEGRVAHDGEEFRQPTAGCRELI